MARGATLLVRAADEILGTHRVPGITIRCIRRCRDSSRAKAAIIARSAQSGFGRATWRAQEGDLVTDHQDFHVLGNISAGEERQTAEQPDHEQIDEAKEHECRG